MKRSIAIIGAGRVGQSLGRALRLKGYRVDVVATRSVKSARQARRFIGGGTPLRAPVKEVPDAGFVLIATPDDQIAAAAKALAGAEGSWRSKVVVHTSGALDSSVLAPLKRRGASVGSLHPINAFPGPVRKFPSGVIFGVEGTPVAVRRAETVVRALRGKAVRVRSQDKALYHAAAVMVAGHLMTLVDLGVRAMTRSGVPARQARAALLPLVFGTVGNYSKEGGKTWTGPIERGDSETVRRHLRALGRMPRSYRDAYVALGLAGLDLYKPKRGRAAISRLLRGGSR